MHGLGMRRNSNATWKLKANPLAAAGQGKGAKDQAVQSFLVRSIRSCQSAAWGRNFFFSTRKRAWSL